MSMRFAISTTIRLLSHGLDGKTPKETNLKFALFLTVGGKSLRSNCNNAWFFQKLVSHHRTR
ncbi:hypothetical protein BpHYR1_050474 [Brachionus plicatilis]|uniref:Uncharacterized protein n=1 Tax=Brachionus plicatilis TaxID=10195 RepID=A0A3M7RPG4_BRAPC|nr:hypothetical protein BpHYR1_050474 [Brachionus plicatilis]